MEAGASSSPREVEGGAVRSDAGGKHRQDLAEGEQEGVEAGGEHGAREWEGAAADNVGAAPDEKAPSSDEKTVEEAKTVHEKKEVEAPSSPHEVDGGAVRSDGGQHGASLGEGPAQGALGGHSCF